MTAGNNSTDKDTGTGFNEMDEKHRHDMQGEGGKVSAKSSEGAAGKTDAARRGGENSHDNQ